MNDFDLKEILVWRCGCNSRNI